MGVKPSRCSKPQKLQLNLTSRNGILQKAGKKSSGEAKITREFKNECCTVKLTTGETGQTVASAMQECLGKKQISEKYKNLIHPQFLVIPKKMNYRTLQVQTTLAKHLSEQSFSNSCSGKIQNMKRRTYWINRLAH